jgi:hypothetical protein
LLFGLGRGIERGARDKDGPDNWLLILESVKKGIKNLLPAPQKNYWKNHQNPLTLLHFHTIRKRYFFAGTRPAG